MTTRLRDLRDAEAAAFEEMECRITYYWNLIRASWTHYIVPVIQDHDPGDEHDPGRHVVAVPIQTTLIA